MNRIIGLLLISFLIPTIVFSKGKKSGNDKVSSIIAATYNVRVDNANDAKKGDGWRVRLPKIADVIRFNSFDIFGSQEVHPAQLADMAKVLPEYSYIGKAHTPVFFNKERLECMESGDFTLSPDGNDKIPAWDAAYVRSCTWGKFRDKISGKHFWFFNIHFDHKGEKARVESARLMLSKITEICKDPSLAIFTGDFNCNQNSEPYGIITNSDIFSDSFKLTKNKLAWGGTFNGFDPQKYNHSRIDHIFLGKSFNVKRFGILYLSYRSEEENDSGSAVKVRMPSDHYPVMVELTF